MSTSAAARQAEASRVRDLYAQDNGTHVKDPAFRNRAITLMSPQDYEAQRLRVQAALDAEKEIAELNSKQLEDIRVRQLANKARRGGELTDVEVRELGMANTPEARKVLKQEGKLSQPLKDAAAVVGLTVAASSAPVLAPVLALPALVRTLKK